MALLFEDKVRENRPQFVATVIDDSKEIQAKPNWLMAVMFSESGFDHRIVNQYCAKSGGSADTCSVGLIQFTPDVARRLGTTPSQLIAMSNVQQLEYVKRYFLLYKNKITSFYDLYLVTFNPAAVGRGDDYVIGSSAGEIKKYGKDYPRHLARANSGMDMNGDGLVTVADFKRWIREKRLPMGVADSLEEKEKLPAAIYVEKYTKRNAIWLIIAFVFIAAGVFLLIKYGRKKTKQL